MKKTYNAPEWELILIGNDDVITTSGNEIFLDDQYGEEIDLPEVGM